MNLLTFKTEQNTILRVIINLEGETFWFIVEDLLKIVSIENLNNAIKILDEYEKKRNRPQW